MAWPLQLRRGVRNLVVAASLLFGACAFEPGDFSQGDRPTGGNNGNGTGSGTGSGSDTVPRRTCEFDNTALKLCLDFEDSIFDPMVTDASTNRLDSPTNDVGKVTRGGGTKVAAVFQPFGSRIDVPESLALDIPGSLTMEMWVHPLAYTPANLLNNAGQYRLELDGYQRVICTVGSVTARSVGDADPYKWSHVACVYDGNSLRVFVDGDLSAETSASSGAPISGTTGTRIAGNYGGQLDDIRVYAGALAPSDICTHAGETDCSTSINNGGPGGG